MKVTELRRALTLRQPWPDLVIAGVKPVENRSWPVPTWAYTCPDCGGSGADARATEAALAYVPCPTCDGTDLRDEGTGECWPWRLWIHAGLAKDATAPWAVWRERAVATGRNDVLAYGALLGSVTVTGCHPASGCYLTGHQVDACTCSMGSWSLQPHEPGCGLEPFCSPWSQPDAYHWTLADPVALPEPIPLRGRQGLWTLPEDLEVAA